MRRIETAYDDLGRRSTVVQWSAATGGSATDGVKFSYDGWGNVISYRQDRNSAVDQSGSVDDYELTYTWDKATGARHAVRLDTITLPSGAVVEARYRSVGGRFDDDVSRVTALHHGMTPVVVYEYNGLGHVVGTSYPEPGIRWNLFEDASGSGDYPDIDDFNRHGSRPGSVFPKATGDVAAKNSQGQSVLDDILGNVGKSSPNKFGGVDFFGGSRGGGARFDAQGKFMGFLEP